MSNKKPKFREGDFVYYLDEDKNVSGNFIYKYVKNSQTLETKYLVGSEIKNEDDIFHTRYEAENNFKSLSL